MDVVSLPRSDASKIQWLLLLPIFALFAFYFDTFASMVRVWYEIDAFTYGFLIFPISAYLIWQDRDRLRQLSLSRSVVGLFVLSGLSFLWWISDSVGVQVISQLSVVAMIGAIVLTLMGSVYTRAIAFPLGYLLLAVPFGEIFIPHLIDFTAFFAIEALTALGIPVYRDGPFFYIPTGSFEVAKACSGIRFLIATFAMSMLLQHLYFKKFARKLAFVLLAVVLAVVSNGIRATTVVLILHYTDLNIAAPQDHKWVGWLVYGILIALLISIAHRYQDDRIDEQLSSPLPRGSTRFPLRFTLFAIIAISVGPVVSLAVQTSESNGTSDMPRLPTAMPGWVSEDSSMTEWRPAFIGYSGMRIGGFSHNSRRVDLAIVRYLGQRQGAEISNIANSVVDSDEWIIREQRNIAIDLETPTTLRLQEVIAANRADGTFRIVWSWIEVNGTPVQGALQTKIAEVKSAITFRRTRSNAIISSTLVRNSISATRPILEHFVRDYYANIRQCINVNDYVENCGPPISNLETK